MANSTNYPVRQWLDFTLHRILLTSGIPALNQGFTEALLVDPARQNIPGFVLPHLSENTLTIGELHSLSELTLSVVNMGSSPNFEQATNTFFRTFKTRLIWKMPTVGAGAPEDFSMVHGVFCDTLLDLLADASRYAITPTDPDTDAPSLPGDGCFISCWCGDITPMPMPVKSGDGVTYVQGGYCDHFARFVLAADRPGRIA